MEELRDWHGRWTVGGGSAKTEVIKDVLRSASKSRPRTQHDINVAIHNRHGASMGPFTDRLEAGQHVRELEKQGIVKSKWLPDRKARGYYLAEAPVKAKPAGPTKTPAKRVARVPTKVENATPSPAGNEFHITSRHGGPETISGATLEHALRERFGDDAEIRDIGGHKYVFKNGRMVARIKRPGEKQFHGPQNYLNA